MGLVVESLLPHVTRLEGLSCESSKRLSPLFLLSWPTRQSRSYQVAEAGSRRTSHNSYIWSPFHLPCIHKVEVLSRFSGNSVPADTRYLTFRCRLSPSTSEVCSDSSPMLARSRNFWHKLRHPLTKIEPKLTVHLGY